MTSSSSEEEVGAPLRGRAGSRGGGRGGVQSSVPRVVGRRGSSGGGDGGGEAGSVQQDRSPGSTDAVSPSSDGDSSSGDSGASTDALLSSSSSTSSGDDSEEDEDFVAPRPSRGGRSSGRRRSSGAPSQQRAPRKPRSRTAVGASGDRPPRRPSGRPPGRPRGRGGAARDGVDEAGAALALGALSTAAQQQHTVVLQDEDGLITTVSATMFADVLSAYHVLRSFSWQLRLSPFSLQSLVVALASGSASALLDEVMVALLRALAAGETPRERKRHRLDLTMLDNVSWPEFVWEWLHLSGDADDLLGHRVKAVPTSPGADTAAPLPLPVDRTSGPDTAYDAARLRAEWKAVRARTPAAHLLQQEFYTLGPDINARILARLADDLLSSPHIRTEIDRRETSGQLVAGRGGADGAFAMRSAAERRKRVADAAKAAEAAKKAAAGGEGDEGAGGEVVNGRDGDAEDEDDGDDGNTDRCVLCGTGGSLLCCDACPAAYHLRCINENNRSLPTGEWLCPECRVGGRGEAAGTRVPVAGVAPPSYAEPAWVAYGCLFQQHCLPPPKRPKGIRQASGTPGGAGAGRRQVWDDLGDAGVTMHTGRGAESMFKKLILCRPRARDERPHPSSLSGLMPGEDEEGEDGQAGEEADEDDDAGGDGRGRKGRKPDASTAPQGLAAGPHSGLTPLGEKASSPDHYVNRYRNAWVHAMAAYQQHIEGEARRLRRIAGGAAQMAALPLPLPLSRYQWPQSQGKGKSGAVRRCGRCAHCLRPTLKKACLAPLRKDQAPAAPGPSLKAGRLPAVQNWLLRAERELGGVLEGPWGGAGAGSVEWRRAWAAGVRAVGEQQPAALPSSAPSASTPEAANGPSASDKPSTDAPPPASAASPVPAADTATTAAGQQQPVALGGGEAPGRASVQQLARSLLQLEAGVRRQLHVLHSGWEPCSRPGKEIVQIWGFPCHTAAVPTNAIGKNGSEQGGEALDTIKPRRSVSELRDGDGADAQPTGRGRRGRVRSRAPRHIYIPDSDTEVAVPIWFSRRNRFAGPPQSGGRRGDKGGSYDGTVDGDSDGGEGDEAEGGGRKRPDSQGRAAKRPRRSATGEDDAEGGDGGQQPDMAGSSRRATPAPPTPMDVASPPAAAASAPAVKREVKPERVPAGPAPSPTPQLPETALPRSTAQNPTPAPSELASAGGTVADGMALDADGTGDAGGDADDDADGGERERKRRRRRYGSPLLEPRVRPARAAALAATSKAKNQLSGRLAAIVQPAPAGPPRRDERRSTRRSATAGGSSRPSSRTGPSGDINPMRAFPSDDEDGASSGSEAGGWWAAGLAEAEEARLQAKAINRAAIISGWRWLRKPEDRAAGRGYLPRSMARKLGRLGGSTLIPSVVQYRETGEPDLVPRLAWVAATERVTTSGALALQVRHLNQAVRWQALKRPPLEADLGSSPWSGLTLAAHRSLAPGPACAFQGYHEYFVVPEGATAAEVYLALGAVATAAQGGAAPPGEEAFIERPGEEQPFLCHWAAEFDIPLWMVRSYQERVRTDDARVGASGARDGRKGEDEGGVTDVGGVEDATCAACGADYGEEAEKDALWLQCDLCRRWYHGACVSMSQAAADAAAATDSQWHCRSCIAGYRTRRQAAGRRAKPRPSGGVGTPGAPGGGGAAGIIGGATPILRLGPDGQPVGAEEIEAELRELQAEAAARAAARAAAAAAQAARRAEQRRLAAATGVPKKPPRKRRKGSDDDDDDDEPSVSGDTDDEEAQAEAEGRIYCVCQRRYTRDQAPFMVGCDECNQWFHFACVGTSREEVAAYDRWYCPNCAASRTTLGLPPPARKKDGATTPYAGPGTGSGKKAPAGRPKRADLLQGPTSVVTPAQAAAARGAGYDWRSGARAALVHVMAQALAEPFLEPVPEDVPDYYDTIDTPMDLGTVKEKLDAGQYSGPAEFLADVALVWTNCHTYNRSNSVIAKAATQLAAVFRDRWAAADVDRRVLAAAGASAQLPAGAPAVAPDAGAAPRAEPQEHPHHRRMMEAAAAAVTAAPCLPNLPTAPPAVRPIRSASWDGEAVMEVGRPSGNPAFDNWAARARIVLKALVREGCVAPFLAPPPRLHPGEAPPASLSEISDRLSVTVGSMTPAAAVSRGGYSPMAAGLARFLDDVASLWDHWAAFSLPHTDVGGAAAAARSAFARLATQHGLPTAVPPALRLPTAAAAAAGDALPAAPSASAPTPQLAAAPSAGATAGGAIQGPARSGVALRVEPTNSVDWPRIAADTVKLVIADPECGWPFARPVKAADAPGYLDVIKQPMDLGTIADKLRRRKYTSEAEFLSDVNLVWSNCFEYNEEGDDYYNMGMAAQALFARMYRVKQQPHATDLRRVGASAPVPAALSTYASPKPGHGGATTARTASGRPPSASAWHGNTSAGGGGGAGAPAGVDVAAAAQALLARARESGSLAAGQHQRQQQAPQHVSGAGALAPRTSADSRYSSPHVAQQPLSQRPPPQLPAAQQQQTMRSGPEAGEAAAAGQLFQGQQYGLSHAAYSSAQLQQQLMQQSGQRVLYGGDRAGQGGQLTYVVGPTGQPMVLYHSQASQLPPQHAAAQQQYQQQHQPPPSGGYGNALQRPPHQ